MNRRSKYYHQYAAKALGPITKRKQRLLRIYANRVKRTTTLTTKAKALNPFYQKLEKDFRGRDGWPIPTRQYLRHQADPDYIIVACDWHKGVKVSTVWLGKHWPTGFGNDYLFETMVFIAGTGADTWKYKTEAEAIQGHAKMLEEIKLRMDPCRRIAIRAPDQLYTRSLVPEMRH